MSSGDNVMSLEACTDFISGCHVKDTAGFLAKCGELRVFLEETNKVTNLTNITGEEEFLIKHVADSLASAAFFPFMSSEKLEVCDIGCGAGFPSLILAAAFPNLSVTAVDSTQKKIAFVEEAARRLGLGNLTAVPRRANEMSRDKEWRGRFDVITARAVSTGISIFKDTAPMLKGGGLYMFYKTPNQIQEELPEMTKKVSAGGFFWGVTKEFELPGGMGRRQFLFGGRRGGLASKGVVV